MLEEGVKPVESEDALGLQAFSDDEGCKAAHTAIYVLLYSAYDL